MAPDWASVTSGTSASVTTSVTTAPTRVVATIATKKTGSACAAYSNL
jgi:hypothetical protein